MFPYICDGNSKNTNSPLKLQPLLAARFPPGTQDDGFMPEIQPYPSTNVLLAAEKLVQAMPLMTETEYADFWTITSQAWHGVSTT